MERICLLVDLNTNGLDQTWMADVEGKNFSLKLSYVSFEEVQPMMETGCVVSMVIFSEHSGNQVIECLTLFRKYVGTIPSFQALVAQDPDPMYLTEVFEYGVELYLSPETWAAELVEFTEHIAALVEDPESIESKTLALNHSIAYGDQGQIVRSKEALGNADSYDYIAAYAKANALQAIGQYNEAVEVYRASQQLNKTFRQASNSLGESLLVLGKVDEAIEILERLEKQNPRCVERKANLATAYYEKGDVARAEELLAEAESIHPGHSRVAEARAEILLASGKVGEAFKMMDSLQDVGPFFAAKLNEMGIKLSQQGKGKSAIALYKKAHKIVRHELKYKISLNAALACYRMAEYPIALQYLSRCEKEYGGTYEKVEKIRAAIRKVLKSAPARAG